MWTTLKAHWPEYFAEAALLGCFLISATAFTALIEHEASPVRAAIADPLVRRIPMGIAMGCTAILLVYSPWGRLSGAHMNPALTLTFLRLGRVAPVDAAAYIGAQFAGAVVVMSGLRALAAPLAGHPTVNYASTHPGPLGHAAAFGAEVLISFGMATLVLALIARPRLAPYTGIFAGLLVATYITIEAPISGMSMNPARTFGPALASGVLDDLYIYFAAPLAGMLLAGEVRRRLAPGAGGCAKYHHDARVRCIHCGHDPAAVAAAGAAVALDPQRT